MTKTKTSSELHNKVLTEACKGNESTFKGIKESVLQILWIVYKCLYFFKLIKQ